MRRSGRTLLAAAALLLLAVPAHATGATVLQLLNVRSGPGTNFPVISQIPPGSYVRATACNPDWCTIEWPGPAFVAASFLGFNGPPPYVNGPLLMQAPAVVAAPPQVYVAPPGPPIYVAPPPPVYYGPPPPPPNGAFFGVPPGPGPGVYGGVGVYSW